MFAESLVESTGRLRTHRRSLALVSLLFQAAIVTMLALWPLIHPAQLPPHALTFVVTAPPPMSRPSLPQVSSVSRAVVPTILTLLTAPGRIHPATSAEQASDNAPGPIGGPISDGSSGGNNLAQIFNDGTGKQPTVALAKPAPPAGPLRISAGVASGHLLAPIQPIYPAIAKAARVSGTVVVEATISTTGAVLNAHAISGPAMLAGAAVEAVAHARYQPYMLSGQPVEVQTMVNVIFQLN